jgi:hypothetical protein
MGNAILSAHTDTLRLKLSRQVTFRLPTYIGFVNQLLTYNQPDGANKSPLLHASPTLNFRGSVVA